MRCNERTKSAPANLLIKKKRKSESFKVTLPDWRLTPSGCRDAPGKNEENKRRCDLSTKSAPAVEEHKGCDLSTECAPAATSSREKVQRRQAGIDIGQIILTKRKERRDLVNEITSYARIQSYQRFFEKKKKYDAITHLVAMEEAIQKNRGRSV